jgi:hypothetical protein
MTEKPYREYRLRRVNPDGTSTVTVFREWFDPRANRQRKETVQALKYKAKFEQISSGMNKAQHSKLARKVRQAFKKTSSEASSRTKLDKAALTREVRSCTHCGGREGAAPDHAALIR